MKILTETRDGVAIELNRDEYFALEKLVLAVEGKTDFDSLRPYDMKFNLDKFPQPNLQSVFGVIEQYYKTKFKLNELQRGINDLKKVLGEPYERL